MINIEVYGQIKINANFDKFTLDVRDRMLKRGVRDVLTPMKETAARLVRERTGALRGSMDIKVSNKGGKGSQVYGIMGPKTNVRIPVRLIRSGKNAGKILVAIPTRYAHLVEFGHNIVINGVIVGRVSPKPFMRPAWAKHGGDTAFYVLQTSMARQINDWLAALTT